MTNRERIARIQRWLGLPGDGAIGPDTLTAIEQALGIGPEPQPPPPFPPEPPSPFPPQPPATDFNLVVSRMGVDKIIGFEIGGQAFYEKNAARPTWPGGESGVTIGIGFDLGYHTAAQVERIWGLHLPSNHLARLRTAAGLTGAAARNAADSLRAAGVIIPFSTAKVVFHQSTLPEYARRTREAYPGVERLPPDAQAMLLSLIYNRGAGMDGDRRVEMRNIRPLVPRGDLEGIAIEFLKMKRLWPPGSGLLKRRDDEAAIIRASARPYADAELLYV